MNKRDIILDVIRPAFVTECFGFENGEFCLTHGFRCEMYIIAMEMISDNLY